MDCSMPGYPVLHYFLEFAQTHVPWVGDAIQPSHPLWPPSAPALDLSHHQGFFQWVGSSHQVAKVLELEHQSFQWLFKVDLRLTGSISLQSNGLSRVFSNTTVWKHQFLGVQPSLWANSFNSKLHSKHKPPIKNNFHSFKSIIHQTLISINPNPKTIKS